MYEAFFGLKRRPFAATPDANCWYHSERYQAALDELLVCAEQGQGIGVIIAPAGAGKTLLCERLIREIGEPFTSVLLRHATYQSRRGFLQTLLSELAQPFDKPSDQELRLALAPVLRGLGQQGRALLLVVDEAHTLSETLLEELRILADQAEDGKPLVRLVLCGQLTLEDKLAHPQLQALNQRIRAHVSVAPLSMSESADYLDYRITWAGGRTEEMFTREALELITRAADGQPRCLNQVCDHALLLAYVAEERPVTAAHVTDALDDLRHLPLVWNTRLAAPSTEASPASPWAATLGETGSPLADAAWNSEFPAENVVEWGVESSDESSGHPLPEVAPAFGAEEAIDPPAALIPPAHPDAADDHAWQEEFVMDRYAALDAGLQPPPRDHAATRIDVAEVIRPLSNDLFEQTAIGMLQSSNTIDDRLDALQHVLEYVSDGEEPRASVAPRPTYFFEQRRSDDFSPDHTLGASEDVMADNLDGGSGRAEQISAPGDPADERTASEPTSVQATCIEIGSSPAKALTEVGLSESAPPPPRSLRNLFTMLRRKQLGRL
ncbi:MAG: AAA family ATPase [Planctomycetaceae bacterium]|nr:AAA family ATPase [Planctomycetaceae bacterium]